MERAKRDLQTRFTSLAHLIDEDALKHAYERLRKDAAVGVDGVTKEQYGLELESNVVGLLCGVTCYGVFPPVGFRVRPDKGRTDEARTVYGRTNHCGAEGA